LIEVGQAVPETCHFLYFPLVTAAILDIAFYVIKCRLNLSGMGEITMLTVLRAMQSWWWWGQFSLAGQRTCIWKTAIGSI